MKRKQKERWRNTLQEVFNYTKYFFEDGTNVGSLLSLLRRLFKFDPLPAKAS